MKVYSPYIEVVIGGCPATGLSGKSVGLHATREAQLGMLLTLQCLSSGLRAVYLHMALDFFKENAGEKPVKDISVFFLKGPKAR